MNVEYKAVQARLSGISAQTHPMGTRFEVGRLGDGECRVALALAGKGNQAAAVLTERAVTLFAPVAVIFVGVAGALQPHLRLGDVVVASHVYVYHGATSEDDGTTARPRTWELAHRAHQIAARVDRDAGWTQGLPEETPVRGVHFGPVAAGKIALYSGASDVRRWLREHYNDALAVEMEAAGVAQAGHLNDSLPAVMIRGISDYADKIKGRPTPKAGSPGRWPAPPHSPSPSRRNWTRLPRVPGGQLDLRPAVPSTTPMTTPAWESRASTSPSTAASGSADRAMTTRRPPGWPRAGSILVLAADLADRGLNADNSRRCKGEDWSFVMTVDRVWAEDGRLPPPPVRTSNSRGRGSARHQASRRPGPSAHRPVTRTSHA
jgi:nucleoside phosphorylase